MKHLRYSVITLSIAFAVVILLPQFVTAAQQSVIDETSHVKPYESDADETVNIANESIEWNIDTWDPRPAGIFVGGTIKESLMRLHEFAAGDDAQLVLTTIIQPSREYLMSGASQFWVRLPVSVDPDNMPAQVNFAIWKLNSASYSVYKDSSFFIWGYGGFSTRFDCNPYYPEWTFDAHRMALRVAGDPIMTVYNVAHLNPDARPHTPAWPALPLWDSPGTSSYLTGGRLYVHITAPLMPDYYYVLGTQVFYESGQPMDVYLCPSDLASDNLTDSRVAYMYWPSPDAAVYRNYPVPADLGYSFVFEAGLGGLAYEYNSWYNTNDILQWKTYVEVGNATVSGALNFILEYRTNTTIPLEWQLGVALGGAEALNTAYWTHKSSYGGYVLASNPVNCTYAATAVGGSYYLIFECFLRIQTAMRIQFMTVASMTWPGPTNFLAHSCDRVDAGYYFTDLLGFGMWCSISVQNVSLNETDVLNLGHHHTGFWEGIDHWWDDHWLDVVGGELIVIGVFTMAIAGWTGVGAVFGAALICAGIGLILYNNHVLDGILKMIIDGLIWLGNWLWKVASFIWKVLTWVIDQLIDYGSQILAILIYGLAVIVPVTIMTMFTKLMSVFYKIAKGDLTGAAAEAKEMVNQATLGRV